MKRTSANRMFPTVGTMYDSLPNYIFHFKAMENRMFPTVLYTNIFFSFQSYVWAKVSGEPVNELMLAKQLIFFLAKSLKSNLMTSHHSGFEHGNKKLSIGKTWFVFFSFKQVSNGYSQASLGVKAWRVFRKNNFIHLRECKLGEYVEKQFYLLAGVWVWRVLK